MPRPPRLAAPSFALLLLAGLVCPPAWARAADASPTFVPGEVLVRYRASAAPTDRASLRAGIRAHTLGQFAFIRVERLRVDGLTTEQAVARLKADPRVEFAEPNYEVHSDRTPNDPYFQNQWGLLNAGQTGGLAGADIHANVAWDIFTGDSTLLVGDIDSGFDWRHADLAPNVWTNPGEIPDNGIDDDGNGYVDDVHGYDFANNDGDPIDDNGHGTHTAGTIAAVGDNALGVSGVCWRARIVGIKFLNASGSGTVAGAIDAIQYAIRVGCRLTSNSWGGAGYSEFLRDAISAAGDAGQLFVAAAGNNGRDVDETPNYPSGYDLPNVISVAATDVNDQIAPFSNFGATQVDLAAPGVDILSTFPGNRYALASGTSMATPHVSGVAALAMGRFPGASATTIRDLILRSVDPLPQLQGLCATGGRLNAFVALLVPDSLPPAAIADLRVTDVSSNGMHVAWTATGDDGPIGRAAGYEMRWSTAPLTEQNFASANPVLGVPEPVAAGGAQEFEVGGLPFSSACNIALRAFDELHNTGPISNVVSATTLGIPVLSVTPDSLSARLVTGADTLETLTLANTGAGTLDFSIPPPLIAFAAQRPFDLVPFAKGGESAPGAPAASGHGGPDGFGYRWVDGDEAGGPAFEWIDAVALGRPLTLSGDDVLSGPVDLGFSFPFYDAAYGSLRVCTNGFVTFTDIAASYGNQPLPSAYAPAAMLAPFWEDLDFGQTNRVYVWGDGRRFVIEYLDVPRFPNGGPYTFEIVLDASGEVRYQYLRMADPRSSATVGLQNVSRTAGLTVVFNAAYVRDSLALRLLPVKQWATVSPASGRLRAGESVPLAVRFDAGGMVGGNFRADAIFESNDPRPAPLRVPLALRVLGAPDLQTTPLDLDFGDVFVGVASARTLTLANAGTDTLHIASIRSSDAQVTADTDAWTLSRLDRREVTLHWRPTEVGPFSATLSIVSDDPDTPLKLVPLRGRALPAPSLAVAPDSLAIELPTGATASRVLRLTNHGGSALEFAARPEARGASATSAAHATFVPPAKGDADAVHGAAPGAAGGPDSFGYTWRDSRGVGGPAFAWEDLRVAGTPLALAGDDAVSPALPIGFRFPFYGASYDSFRVGTNGFLTFTSASAAPSNTPLPNPAFGVPENLLAAFWDDLVFTGSARAYWRAGDGRLVVQFQDVPRFGEPDRPNTFEVALSSDGTIDYRWLALRATNLASATVGIQNAARDDGLEVVFNAPFLGDSLAVRIAPPLGWLSLAPRTGTIPPGGSADLTIGLDARGLFGGAYAGDVRLDSNDPLAPTREVPVRLDVRGVAAVELSADSLDFGRVSIGEPIGRELVVGNAGSDTLHVTKLAATEAAVTVDVDHFTLAPFARRVVGVTFAPTAPGLLVAQLLLRSDDPARAEARVALAGAAAAAPELHVAPESLRVALATTLGADALRRTRLVLLQNHGGNDLDWSATARLGPGVAAGPALDAEAGKGATAAPGVSVHSPGASGAGGPDDGGYRWSDSDEPGGPAFAWIDARAGGVRVALDGDDQTSAALALPFAFDFYGVVFDSLRVCTNGYASFTSRLATYTNAPLPNAGLAAPENLLAAFWDDQDFRASAGGAEVWTSGDSSRFVIEYFSVPHADAGGPYTYEIVLHRDGTIDYQYLDMGTRLTEATIGIQNGDRSVGLQVAYNAAYVHDRLCARLTRAAPWLAVEPARGTVAPGAVDTLRVLLDASGEPDGERSGEVLVTTNDRSRAEARIPVRAHVGVSAAEVRVSPHRLGALHRDRDVRVALRVPAHDASAIAPASVLLNGTLRRDPDAAARVENGRLVLRFDQSALIALLPPGPRAAVTATGEVDGETWFAGTDTVRVPRARLVAPAALDEWGAPNGTPTRRVSAGDPLPLAWTDPEDATVEHYEVWWSPDSGATWQPAATSLTAPAFGWLPPEITSPSALLEITGFHGDEVESEWLSRAFVLLRPDLGEGPALPARLELRVAGGNPTSGRAEFDLALPRDGAVEVRVFDVRGARVADLARGPYVAGVHRLRWDGRDASGARAAPGLYFARARVAGTERVARVVLVR